MKYVGKFFQCEIIVNAQEIGLNYCLTENDNDDVG